MSRSDPFVLSTLNEATLSLSAEASGREILASVHEDIERSLNAQATKSSEFSPEASFIGGVQPRTWEQFGNISRRIPP